MSGPSPDPLPATFGVQPQPGTVRDGNALEGGTPRLRVQLPEPAAIVVDALFAGSTVAAAAERAACSRADAGAIARRLVTTAIAYPVPDPARAGGPRITELAAVIPAHDAATTIGAAIAGLTGVGEVIVVDDGSRDDTAAVAAAAGARVIRNDRPTGPAAARNRGIAATTADVVVLLDSDAEPAPGWLEPLLDHLADPHVGGAAPRVLTMEDGSSIGRYEARFGPLDLGPWPAIVRPDGPVTFVSTTALVLRRALWQELDGFDEWLRFGEDLDFAWRAASHRPLVHEPAAVVGHHHRVDLASHLRNRSNYGSAAGPLSRLHPGHPRAAVAPPALTAAALAAVGGFPRTATALAGMSAGITARRLVGLGEAPDAAGRAAALSTLRSARGLAAAASRPWLPVALALAATRRRSRAVVATAVLARLVRAWPRDVPVSTARKLLVLRFLDDLAFSAGVLRGCATTRSIRPLMPRTPSGPARADTVLGTELLLP